MSAIIGKIGNAFAATFLIALSGTFALGLLYALAIEPAMWLAARPVLTGSLAWLSGFPVIWRLCRDEETAVLWVFLYLFASLLAVALIVS